MVEAYDLKTGSQISQEHSSETEGSKAPFK